MKPRPVILHISTIEQNMVNYLAEEVGLPNLLILKNYLQVACMVRDHEVSRILIVLGAYNTGKVDRNGYTGQEAATELHKIDPNIPILILNGRTEWMEWGEKGKGAFVKAPIEFPNEVYLDFDGKEENVLRVKKFFEGHLTQSDAPTAESIGWFN